MARVLSFLLPLLSTLTVIPLHCDVESRGATACIVCTVDETQQALGYTTSITGQQYRVACTPCDPVGNAEQLQHPLSKANPF